jgi:Glycosyltransferase family 87
MLWLVLGVGLAARVAIAFATDAALVDHESLDLVRGVVTADPLDLYEGVEGEDRWPYPPGYLPAILGAHAVAEITGAGFIEIARLVPIATDVGLALLVQHLLGMRGATERTRVAAAAAVALGPIFVGVSAYQAQIDSVAILPALAAFVAWERGGPGRALAAGLLLGAGGAVKTVPLALVLALLPWCRSPREAATLVGAAAAVPLALLAPYLAIGFGDVVDHLSYRGFPGLGGLSMLAQPEFPLLAFAGDPLRPNAVTDALIDAGGVLPIVALIAVGALLLRFRPPPLAGAIVVVLVLWVFGVNFFLQYLVWGLPFLLAAAELRRAVQIQLLALPALAVFYLEPSTEWVIWALYTAPVAGLWALSAAMLAARTRAFASRPRSSPSGPTPA